MSEDQGVNEPEQANHDGGTDSGFTPPATQEELNKIISERLTRERAKFADYKDLAAKAARFDELEQANKTEAQRLSEQVAAAQEEAATARAELLRYRIATQHGITDADDIDLFLTGSDEDRLTQQAIKLAARSVNDSRPRLPKPDPNQGRSGDGPATTADQFAGVVGGFLN